MIGGQHDGAARVIHGIQRAPGRGVAQIAAGQHERGGANVADAPAAAQ